jgi:ribosomal protein S17
LASFLGCKGISFYTKSQQKYEVHNVELSNEIVPVVTHLEVKPLSETLSVDVVLENQVICMSVNLYLSRNTL